MMKKAFLALFASLLLVAPAVAQPSGYIQTYPDSIAGFGCDCGDPTCDVTTDPRQHMEVFTYNGHIWVKIYKGTNYPYPGLACSELSNECPVTTEGCYQPTYFNGLITQDRFSIAILQSGPYTFTPGAGISRMTTNPANYPGCANIRIHLYATPALSWEIASWADNAGAFTKTIYLGQLTGAASLWVPSPQAGACKCPGSSSTIDVVLRSVRMELCWLVGVANFWGHTYALPVNSFPSGCMPECGGGSEPPCPECQVDKPTARPTTWARTKELYR